MATAYSDSEFQTRNVRQFTEEVKKNSGGKLDITVHSAQSLIKNPEIKRSIQTGLVQAGEFFLSNLGPENPLYEIEAIPFLAANLWCCVQTKFAHFLASFASDSR
jgi:TRAP-type C4-dicarboxylate transport system substrate-binding protein